jgi:hypothetical protein
MTTPKFLLQIGNDVENNAIFVAQDQTQVTTNTSQALQLQIYDIQYDPTSKIVTLVIDTNIGNRLSGNSVDGYSIEIEGVEDFETWNVTVPEALLWRLGENQYLRFDFTDTRFFFNENFIRRAGDDVVPVQGGDLVRFLGRTESMGAQSSFGFDYTNEGVAIKSGDEIVFPEPMAVIEQMIVNYQSPRKDDFFDWTKDSNVSPSIQVADNDVMYDTEVVPQDLNIRIEFQKGVATPVLLWPLPPEQDDDEGELPPEQYDDEGEQKPSTKENNGLGTVAITLIVVFSVLIATGISVAIWQGIRKKL